VATDQCITLYDALWSVGPEFGLKDAGYYTIDALRIEAGRRAWGAELGTDDTPWEAGLDYAVRLDKRDAFTGRDALLRQHAEGLNKRLLIFSFDDPAAFAWGGEPILNAGINVGELSSAGYSRKLGRAIAMGYVRSDAARSVETLLGASFEIDIAGSLFAATPHLKLA
jgi:4-methylaminobutanoate oxidase (formaldehyde-forming)